MDRIETLKKLSKNPHYRLSPKQAAELELATQEIRADDMGITAPIVKRKRRTRKVVNQPKDEPEKIEIPEEEPEQDIS